MLVVSPLLNIILWHQAAVLGPKYGRQGMEAKYGCQGSEAKYGCQGMEAKYGYEGMEASWRHVANMGGRDEVVNWPEIWEG